MSQNDRSDDIEHRFADTVRDTMGTAVYGDWRAIHDADAVPLAFGFPYLESLPNEELRHPTPRSADQPRRTAIPE